jgi:hypothetical protein
VALEKRSLKEFYKLGGTSRPWRKKELHSSRTAGVHNADERILARQMEWNADPEMTGVKRWGNYEAWPADRR